MSEERRPESPTEVQLRLWPAVLIAVAHGIALWVSMLAPTVIANVAGIIGSHVISTLLLIIWWLVFSRAPWRDRLIGVGIVAAVLVWVAFSQQRDGARLLVFALPSLTMSSVLLLLLTMRLPWRKQRMITLLAPLGCAIVFPMFRVEDVGSNLSPLLAWRWSPTSEELLAATSTAPMIGARADLPVLPDPADWPGFRGAARDGKVTGATFSTNWNDSPPKQLWRRRVGLGYSSFVAVGDYLFTQEQRQEDEAVICYRADSGEEIWINLVKARFEDPTGSGPRSTPSFDGGKLYAQGALGLLQCLDAATGAVIWKKDIAADTGASVPTWGFTSSPLVTDKLVVVFAGGSDGKSVAAYDKLTGDRVWCAGGGTHGYSSAQLSSIADVPQILMTSGFGVQSFAPETGALLWENAWPVKMNPRVVQPLVLDGSAVLVGTADGKGTRFLQIAKTDANWSVEEKWTIKTFRPYFNDFVLHKGYCYGFDGDMFVCIDSHSGEVRWKGKKYGGQVLLVADMDALVILSEKGNVALVRAVPDAFEEVAQFKALTGKTWNHPVIAHGKLFVRNAEEAACFELL